MEWPANSNLLEIIVDKLNPSSSPEAQANTAETLGAMWISLLDSERATYSPLVHLIRSLLIGRLLVPCSKLGDLLKLLNVCSDSMVLPATYGLTKASSWEASYQGGEHHVSLPWFKEGS
ncbi:uncharacterized protein LOC113347614 [Papaver somniferum]|uniref:uncharacterized protein LOC113347614 n=1 Tax=Papaver somniferum TaxID=3469 RepID=UPI000E7006C1|nr:uncharacterized protein LOC113347614 [Papaver somniferum]XP_026447065.1 uncharacterized protein LOC113347614 [Papaver somniferum]XP_026447066.1 uncharacterized protein LOC113347614 [Papaver somniferum]XP_026447067.1 uncharacterized protein LOC113347614 [Papaver somniferum]